MNSRPVPPLDSRNAEAIAEDFLALLPAFVPGWQPMAGQPSWAMVQIFARYLRAIAERLNQAPDKNKLAFLDQLGINLLPAQAARAPVVFQSMPKVGDSRVPARTRVGAKLTGQSEPLIFETEQAIALATARLAEVVTLYPGKDAYANHSNAAISGQPFTLFAALKPVPHELYIAHNVHFALAGKAIVDVQFELAQTGTLPRDIVSATGEAVPIVWEFWTGEGWQQFKPFIDPTRAGGTSPASGDSIDGTEGLRRSGVIRLVSDCAKTKPTRINGFEAYWIRGRLTIPIPPTANLRLPLIDRISIRTSIQQVVNTSNPTALSGGLRPDLAFADGLKLDTTKSFYPLGQQPQPGTAFYLSCAEALSKPGAKIRLDSQIAQIARDESGTAINPVLIAEYWQGQQWQSLGVSSDQLTQLFTSKTTPTFIEFTVPSNQVATRVNEQEGLWIRIRVVSGTFAKQRVVTWPGAPGQADNTLTIVETHPPALADFRIGYDYQSPLDVPETCLTYNDFQWQDRSDNARWRGNSFEPFAWVEDRTPTLYLGFDRALPADLISLYLDIQEQAAQIQAPLLKWEYWDATAWRSLTVEDETRNLRQPGLVKVLWPGVSAALPAAVLQGVGNLVQLVDARDAVAFAPGDLLYVSENDTGELATVVDIAQDQLTLKTPLARKYGRAVIGRALLPRFGQPRTWLRARLQSDGEPLQTQGQGMYLNAVWAAQIQTIDNEVLGTSNGQPNQVFFLRNTPVLAAEQIEVRELEGARAAVELPLLMQDLQQHGLTEADVRTVTDRRTGKITEVWVRWQERPNLFFSSGNDRHYLLERSRGRLLFGDGRQGRIPPVGKDNIRALQYRSGGGLVGNVSQNQITQLLSGVTAQSIHNPRSGEGGADGETVSSVLQRGPKSLRHRYQAIALADYEALAREASPAIAVARALPTTHPSGRPAPGWVKLIIMPQSQDPQPQPSFALRRQVEAYLSQRMPAAIADQIVVTGPDYLPVGVEAIVIPVNPPDAGIVLERVREALTQFLNPLTGGPAGLGWTFGRSVYLSDVAAMLERVAGVDYISQLNLLRDGTPQPEEVVIPADRIVVAGPLRMLLQGEED